MNEYNNRTGDFGPQPATYKTGRPAEPLPQPECAVCHQFGPDVVQNAIQSLAGAIEDSQSPAIEYDMTLVSSVDLSVLITALERHHQQG